MRRVSTEPKSSVMAFCARRMVRIGTGGEERRGVEGTYRQRSVGLAAAVARGGREVLPEEGVVDVASAVEVEEGGGGGGFLGVAGGDGVEGAVEAGHVGLVVFLVVEFHDLARDVGLEGAVVVWTGVLASRGCGGGESRRNRTYTTDLGGWPCRGRSWCWPERRRASLPLRGGRSGELGRSGGGWSTLLLVSGCDGRCLMCLSVRVSPLTPSIRGNRCGIDLQTGLILSGQLKEVILK